MQPTRVLPLLVAISCAPAAAPTTRPPGSPTAGTVGTGGSGGNTGQPARDAATASDAPLPTGTAGSGGSSPGTDAPSAAGAERPPTPTFDGPRPAQTATLPMVVTDHFENQGWFGDGTVVAHFRPGTTIIRQVPGTAGPCAARPPGARGKCLEVTYTPPAGLTPPSTGGWAGVYFLRSLAMLHNEVMPAARPGEPNWGLEPGLDVAPGAAKITFFAAAAQAGARVTFRAGTDKDSFVLPEKTETLGTAWAAYEMPLAGATYAPGVLGAFAWVWKDTTKPVTFYLDGITWEAATPGAPMPPRPPVGMRDGVRQMVIINSCKEPIWAGVFGAPLPEGGGFRLDAGARRTFTLPNNIKWTGRIWGRTGCSFAAGGVGSCETGDCGPRETCGGTTGKTPATLAELTLSAGGVDPDFYDLSLVDGYNLPMAMAPLEGTYTKRAGAAFDCLMPSCTSDLNLTCPAELRMTNAGGKVVGCLSACERFKTDEFCCAGAHDKPETCPPFSYSRAFKAACPTAYSYAYDDATSTFTCKGEDYAIWFCP